MLDSIGYIISSHVRYMGPLKRLLDSMSYIEPERIKVVVGGADRRYEDGNYIYVPHNSFDYNGFIDFVEFKWPLSNHVICLHDTVEFMPTTDEKLKNTDPDLFATAVFGGQCNLITYRADTLFAWRNEILSWKNCDKARAIQLEGWLFKQLPREKVGSYNSNCIILGVEKPYGDTERIKELYDAVNIIKYKANYGQPGAFTLKP